MRSATSRPKHYFPGAGGYYAEVSLHRPTFVALVIAAAAAFTGCGTQGSDETAVCPNGNVDVVGLSIGEARPEVHERGCSLRVIERNGKPLLVHLDEQSDRINVAVEGGTITRMDGLY